VVALSGVVLLGVAVCWGNSYDHRGALWMITRMLIVVPSYHHRGAPCGSQFGLVCRAKLVGSFVVIVAACMRHVFDAVHTPC